MFKMCSLSRPLYANIQKAHFRPKCQIQPFGRQPSRLFLNKYEDPRFAKKGQKNAPEIVNTSATSCTRVFYYIGIKSVPEQKELFCFLFGVLIAVLRLLGVCHDFLYGDFPVGRACFLFIHFFFILGMAFLFMNTVTVIFSTMLYELNECVECPVVANINCVRIRYFFQPMILI